MADICAEITGTVWKVEVSVGDAVEEGQVLMILESMKMEIPLEAPEAGTVTAVHVVPGDSIEEEQPLLTLA